VQGLIIVVWFTIGQEEGSIGYIVGLCRSDCSYFGLWARYSVGARFDYCGAVYWTRGWSGALLTTF
jgi:hypothetical protein